MLVTTSTEPTPGTRSQSIFSRIYNFFSENPEYLIAGIYFSANLFELFTKATIKRYSGSAEKGAVFFLFSLLGFFFLNVAQSGISLISKKILQLRKLNQEYHIGPLLIRLYMFNLISCFLLFVFFIMVNMLFYGRPEGIISVLLDRPSLDATRGSRSANILQTLPWSDSFGCAPMLVLIFGQQMVKSLYQPLLAIIGTYRRVFWLGAEKIGAASMRLFLVYLVFNIGDFSGSTTKGVNLIIYLFSYFFVFVVALYGVWDIIRGWLQMASEYRLSLEANRQAQETQASSHEGSLSSEVSEGVSEGPEPAVQRPVNTGGYSQVIRNLDPFLIPSFFSQCGFTMLRTLTYTFTELFSYLRGFFGLVTFSATLHPLSDILVGVGYVIGPRLYEARQNRRGIIGTFLYRLQGPLLVLTILLTIDILCYMLLGDSYILRGISGRQGQELTYTLGMGIVALSILRGISFLLPPMGLITSRAPLLFINYFFTFSGFAYLIYNFSVSSELMIAVTLIVVISLNLMISLIVVYYYDAQDLRELATQESQQNSN